MKKELLTLSAAIMILATPAKAQNCAVPPTCESLGYSKTANECTGLDILRCPFDNTKVFCTQGYKVQAAIGDILFSDMTTSSNQITDKTPIGIVFDSTQRLAVALTRGNSTIRGSYNNENFYFESTNGAAFTLIADLPTNFYLEATNYNIITNEDGKKNTELMAKHIEDYNTNVTKTAEDFVTLLRTTIENGLDTYVEEARRSCIGCSESEIQSQAGMSQWGDLNEVRAVELQLQEFIARSTQSEYPFTEVLKYKTDGTKAGDWFIPSQQELKLIGMNINLILDSFRKVNTELVQTNTPFMSSNLSESHIDGITLSNYCFKEYGYQNPCSYNTTTITFLYSNSNSYTPVNYFPVIKF